MKNKIRAGIIGCGNIAGLNELDPLREKPCTHIGAYLCRKDVEVIGCCDIDLRRAKRFAGEFKLDFYTDSIDKLLSQKIDLLSICVPYKQHFQVVNRVLGKKNLPSAIFLEKPISDDLNKAKAMAASAERKQVKLYVNNRRLSSSHQALREIIKKRFGRKMISVSAWCSSGIHAIGIHIIDLIRDICGEPEWVFARREKEKVKKLAYSHNFSSDDPRFQAMIGFKDLTLSLFNSAKTEFTYFEIEILFKNGRIRVSDNGKKIIYQEKAIPGKSTLSYKLGRETQINFTTRPLFRNLIDEIIDGDYKTSPINAEEALKSYKIIDLMKKSAGNNKIWSIK